MTRSYPFALLSLCLTFSISNFATAEDWLQFRGPNNQGVAVATDLPESWDGESGTNVAWKADLPGQGPSSPIFVKGRVFVTASGGRNQSDLFVLAFDAKTGEEVWRRSFKATGRTLTHATSAVAAPSPVSDGSHIVAFYSSNDLFCLDLDGNLKWFRGLASDYPKVGNDIGMAASPVIIDETVIVQAESQGDSFAAGIDVQTGKNRWKIARERQSNWTSPVAYQPQGSPALVLLQSGNGISAHDPRTGEEHWSHATDCDRIAPPLAEGDDVILTAGGLTKLAIVDDEPEVVWESAKLAPGSPSPILSNGRVYTVNRGGILSCADTEGGSLAWKLRLDIGSQWSTPVIAGNRLYSFATSGKAAVVELGDAKGELLGVSMLEPEIKGSPAIADDAIYVRSDSTIWKLAK